MGTLGRTKFYPRNKFRKNHARLSIALYQEQYNPHMTGDTVRNPLLQSFLPLSDTQIMITMQSSTVYSAIFHALQCQSLGLIHNLLQCRRDDTSALIAAVIFKNSPIGIVTSLIDHGADVTLECTGIRDPQNKVNVRVCIFTR